MRKQLFECDVPKGGMHHFSQLGEGFQRGCCPRQFSGLDKPRDHGRCNCLGGGAKMKQVSRFERPALFLPSDACGRDSDDRVRLDHEGSNADQVPILKLVFQQVLDFGGPFGRLHSWRRLTEDREYKKSEANVNSDGHILPIIIRESILERQEFAGGSVNETNTDVIQGTLHMLILKTLSLEPMHGFGIARRIEQISQDVFKINPGSLLTALQRLERAGMARC